MRLIIVLLLLASVAPAEAQTLIASQETYKHTWAIVRPGTDAAQTFTVGAGQGGDLDSIEVWCSRAVNSGTLTVELRNVSGGEPGTTTLWSSPPYAFSTFPVAEVVGFKVAPQQTVTLLEQTSYAIVLRASNGNATAHFQWAGGEGNEYTAGTAFCRQGTDPWKDLSSYNIDRHFRVYTR